MSYVHKRHSVSLLSSKYPITDEIITFGVAWASAKVFGAVYECSEFVEHAFFYISTAFPPTESECVHTSQKSHVTLKDGSSYST